MHSTSGSLHLKIPAYRLKFLGIFTPQRSLLRTMVTTFDFICSSPKKFLLRKCSICVLYNLISVQPYRCTRSSDVVTLARPPSSSSLKVNNRSFRHTSPCLWNDLSKELGQPADHEDLSLSSDLTHISSSFAHFLHHHSHHPSLLLSFTPYSSCTFPHTGLTPRTSAVFLCFLGHVGV